MKFKNVLSEIDDKFYPIYGWKSVRGIPVEIENKKGSLRTGFVYKNPMGGTQWLTKFSHHYGRIPNTKARDGDEINVFIGNDSNSDKVYIIKQYKLGSNKQQFDEVKCFLNFSSSADAKRTYFDHNTKANELYGGIFKISFEKFKKLINKNIKNTKKKNERNL